MKFGVQFFPDVSPQQKSARDYFRDCLEIAAAAEPLGFTHVRTVEHYFNYYGGYSPNPIVFLTALSQVTKTSRLVTGAVLPVFNKPLKLAGEIGMLDAISNGRLEVGFARAFLPHEFRRFGISPNESVARFREGIEQVELLLTREDVTHHGEFHRIENTTSLPRPTQLPRPPFYIAALTTPESFEFAGRMGYKVMAIPMLAAKMRELLPIYRDAWRKAGHAGDSEVMLAFHMLCHKDSRTAREMARTPYANYLNSLVSAASDWTEGLVQGLSGLRQDHRAAQGLHPGEPDRDRRRPGRLARRNHRPDPSPTDRVRRLRARLAADQLQPDRSSGCAPLAQPVRRRGDAANRQDRDGAGKLTRSTRLY